MAAIANYKDNILQSAAERLTRDNPFHAQYSVPSTPDNFVAIPVTSVSEEGNYIVTAKLSWDAVVDTITGYVVYYNIVGDADIQSISVASNHFEYSAIPSGQQYEFSVSAINVDSESAITAKIVVNFVVDTIPPGDALNLSYQSSIGATTIFWDNPVDIDFSHIKLFSSTTNDVATATPALQSSADSHTFTSATEGETVYYWIKAFDYSGNESNFFPATTVGFAVTHASTYNYLVPSVPIGILLSQNNILTPEGSYVPSIKAVWGESTPNVTGYVVRIKDLTSLEVFYIDAPSTILSTQNVQIGRSYEVSIKSVNLTSESAYSAAQTIALTGDAVPPALPTSFTSTPEANGAYLFWLRPVDADFLHTEVWKSLTNDRLTATLFTTNNGNGFFYNISTQDQIEYFWIRSVDKSGNATDFNPSGSTAGVPVFASGGITYVTPDTPTNVLVTQLLSQSPEGVFSATLKINWLFPPQHITKYRVSVTNTGTLEETILELPQTFVSVPNVTIGAEYSITITSVNGTEQSAATTPVLYTVIGDSDPPLSPFQTFVTAVFGGFNIEWKNPGDADFHHTDIYASQTSDLSTATLIHSSSSTSFFFPETTEGVQWIFWWVAYDSSGNESDYRPIDPLAGIAATSVSSYVYETPIVPTIDSIVESPSLTARYPLSKLDLSYSSSAFATNYTVRWKKVTSSNSYFTMETADVNAVIPYMDVDSYYISVQAHNHTASSPFSADVIFAMVGDITPPSDPIALNVDVRSGVTYLSWDEPPDIDYKITRVWKSLTNDFSTAINFTDTSQAYADYDNTNGAYYYWISFVDIAGNESDSYPPSTSGGNAPNANYLDAERIRLKISDLGSVAVGSVTPDFDAGSNIFRVTLTAAGVTINPPDITLLTDQVVTGKIMVIGGDVNPPIWGTGWDFADDGEPEMKSYSIIGFSEIEGDNFTAGWHYGGFGNNLTWQT